MAKSPQDYRHLTSDEEKALFALYCKHGGKITRIVNDFHCIFNTRNQVAYYRDKYDFSSKYQQIVAKKAEISERELREAKRKIVQRAMALIDSRIVLSKGRMVRQGPSSKDIKTAYEIIKTELGEPTKIAEARQGEFSVSDEDRERLEEQRRQMVELTEMITSRREHASA